MGLIKNFIDELAKHKMLVYFVILWGATLFLNTLYGYVVWGFGLSGVLVIDTFFHLSELIAGLLLMLFGIKILKSNFLEGIKNDKMLIYFLFVWAASFFFLGLYIIAANGPDIIEHWENSISLLGGLAALFAGVILGLFSWKMLNEPVQDTT